MGPKYKQMLKVVDDQMSAIGRGRSLLIASCALAFAYGAYTTSKPPKVKELKAIRDDLRKRLAGLDLGRTTRFDYVAMGEEVGKRLIKAKGHPETKSGISPWWDCLAELEGKQAAERVVSEFFENEWKSKNLEELREFLAVGKRKPVRPPPSAETLVKGVTRLVSRLSPDYQAAYFGPIAAKAAIANTPLFMHRLGDAMNDEELDEAFRALLAYKQDRDRARRIGSGVPLPQDFGEDPSNEVDELSGVVTRDADSITADDTDNSKLQ